MEVVVMVMVEAKLLILQMAKGRLVAAGSWEWENVSVQWFYYNLPVQQRERLAISREYRHSKGFRAKKWKYGVFKVTIATATRHYSELMPKKYYSLTTMAKNPHVLMYLHCHIYLSAAWLPKSRDYTIVLNSIFQLLGITTKYHRNAS
jgi:hypothetical protein